MTHIHLSSSNISHVYVNEILCDFPNSGVNFLKVAGFCLVKRWKDFCYENTIIKYYIKQYNGCYFSTYTYKIKSKNTLRECVCMEENSDGEN